MAVTSAGFLDLAPEMRNRVYQFALVSDDHIDPLYVDKKQPAITRICRQVRNESLPLYYAYNTFVLRPPDQVYMWSQQARYQVWVNAIGYENLRRIRTLAIMPPDGFEVIMTQKCTTGALCGRLLDHAYQGKIIRISDDPDFKHFYNGQLRRVLHEISDRKVQPGLSFRAIEKIVRFLCYDIFWYGWTDEHLSMSDQAYFEEFNEAVGTTAAARDPRTKSPERHAAVGRCHNWPDDAEGNDQVTVTAWLQGVLPLLQSYVVQGSR